MFFSDKFFKFALLLFTTCPAILNTNSFTRIAMLPSLRRDFLQDHLELKTPVCGHDSRHRWRMFLHTCTASPP